MFCGRYYKFLPHKDVAMNVIGGCELVSFHMIYLNYLFMISDILVYKLNIRKFVVHMLKKKPTKPSS